MTCREKFRKPNGEGPNGITVLVLCSDIESAKEESIRIGKEQCRPVYERSFRDKGKLTPRYTVYRHEMTTNVMVDEAAS